MPDGTLANLLLEFPDGRAAQITRCTAPRARHTCRLQLLAKHGSARAALPARIEWLTAGGHWSHQARRSGHLTPELLTFFHDMVHSQEPLPPGLAEACRVRRWQQRAEVSWTSGEKGWGDEKKRR
jgi:hypothetical protein